MTKWALLIPLIATVFLAGCNTHHSGHHDNHHYPQYPELEGFYMVDSYLTDSEFQPHTQLRIDPYQDNGQFEIYWDVYSNDDYTVEIRINDVPSLVGSRLVSTDYCGAGLDCDREGVQYCNYDSDFSLICDPPRENNPGQYVTYFDDWVISLPKTLYFILSVCDTRDNVCEDRYLNVLAM